MPKAKNALRACQIVVDENLARLLTLIGRPAIVAHASKKSGLRLLATTDRSTSSRFHATGGLLANLPPPGSERSGVTADGQDRDAPPPDP
jgi:hypothetical protein